MSIRMDLRALKETRWHAYLIRFAFGGVMTVATGLVAKEWGPVIGGLFLAFPAIFPAAATLVEKHERQKKEKVGQKGKRRGRAAAAIDAAGAALGAGGLAAFGALTWELAERVPPWLGLACASGAWFLVAVSLWLFRRKSPGLLHPGLGEKSAPHSP